MELKDYAGTLLESLRERTPLVHCIVNTVVQQFAANVLLAAGASPAMIDHEADAADFAGIADGLLINFGTPTSHQYLSADAAIDTFNQAGKPWVLDPVGFGISGHRTSRIVRALNSRPAVVRGNASEIIGLAQQSGSARGTDSTHSVDDALGAAASLAQTGIVAAVSGESDAIVFADDSGTHTVTITGGSPYMPSVIGTGCSLGALTAAYAAAAAHTPQTQDLSQQARTGMAAATAHLHFTSAAQSAHKRAKGPGTFAAHFLDGLYAARPEDLARIQTTWTTGGTA